MDAQKYVVVVGVLGLAVAGLMLSGPHAQAQDLGSTMAGADGMNTLNSAPTGSAGGGGFYPIDRARNAAALANGNNQMQTGGLNATGGQRQGGRGAGGRGGAAGGRGGATTAAPTGLTAAQVTALASQVVPMITVITGTRVYDATTGDLIDDAVKKQVPQTEKSKYYDDGTNGGDLVANDGIYTSVIDNKDPKAEEKVLGLTSQKVKEQLIMALRVAENWDPIEFYGYEVMSTDRQHPLPRNQAWRVVKDPSGGPGMVLSEEPIDKPIEMPNYREQLKEKDHWVKDVWARSFLGEFRKDGANVTSEFFPVYIPMPPQPPSVVPPAGWVPFADPSALTKAESVQNNPLLRMQQEQQQMNGGGGMNGMMGGGMNSMGGGMNSMGGSSMGGGNYRSGGMNNMGGGNNRNGGGGNNRNGGGRSR